MSKRDSRNINRMGRVGSELNSSECSMGQKQKSIIALVLEYDIIDVRTYKGYKGDLLLEVTTLSNDVTSYIESDAKALGFEVVILQDTIAVYKVYCILYNMSNAYSLKSI
jgi:hypothetical protein